MTMTIETAQRISRGYCLACRIDAANLLRMEELRWTPDLSGAPSRWHEALPENGAGHYKHTLGDNCVLHQGATL